MTLYQVLFEDDDRLGIGRTGADPDVALLPDGRVLDWQAPMATLVDGDYPDYLATDLGLRVCSAHLREVLSANASPRDHLQWLTMRVRSGRDEREYYVLHFPEPPSILHETSLRVRDFVVKPVFDAERVEQHSVTSYESSGPSLFVSEATKRALKRAKCTGLEYSKARVWRPKG